MAFASWTKSIGFAALVLVTAPLALAQTSPAPPVAAPTPSTQVAPAADAPAAATASAAAAEAAPADAAASALDSSYTPMAPTAGKGMPVDKGIDFQKQYSELGEYAHWLDTSVLLPIIVAISLLVLGLLIWVMVRYRAAANPNPSRVTHNTTIEVIWTLVPVLILVGVAVPSIDLLAKQYKPAPASAVTVKVTGYQWYWGYSYPDNGDFEVVSNMLNEEEAIKRGEPHQLAVDNRMVVPAGEPIRIITTASDVIHSFSVPSLWFKMDAVPGRSNEKMLIIKEPGVYYGQCSELCGARHGFMPIAVEALPRAKFDAWVRSQGGTVKGDEVAAAAPAAPAAATTTPAADAAATAAAAPAAAQ
ncbi:cytochrome c oxidase subunit II [Sphingomonas sp. 35-24ZXX]|uniref:cytochrome c oxidase subunit II n=1 Tax=Sphingomonas sp. 35-24ZXX TaxID=1545915 RepID=UPI00053C0149|nr:cytochrome c oxidase subunit II [Sphingomonas sp. 35-24ZXX]